MVPPLSRSLSLSAISIPPNHFLPPPTVPAIVTPLLAVFFNAAYAHLTPHCAMYWLFLHVTGNWRVAIVVAAFWLLLPGSSCCWCCCCCRACVWGIARLIAAARLSGCCLQLLHLSDPFCRHAACTTTMYKWIIMSRFMTESIIAWAFCLGGLFRVSQQMLLFQLRLQRETFVTPSAWEGKSKLQVWTWGVKCNV